MINKKHLLKVALAWINITYVVCFAAVAIFPALRSQFMLYALHYNVDFGPGVTSFGTFFSGLVWWNVIVAAGVILFVWLFNKIKQK